MATDVIGILNGIFGSDLFRTESQVRNSETTRLVGIISEVALSVEISVLDNKLDSFLRGTNSTIGTKTVEDALLGRGRNGVDLGTKREIGERDIIVDTKSELVLGLSLLQASNTSKHKHTFKLSNTAFTMLGVNSLPPIP